VSPGIYAASGFLYPYKEESSVFPTGQEWFASKPAVTSDVPPVSEHCNDA
jgi:hypothetical protein